MPSLLVLLFLLPSLAHGHRLPEPKVPFRCAVLFGTEAADAVERWEEHTRRFAKEPLLTDAIWVRYVEELITLPDPVWTPRMGAAFTELRRLWRTKPLDNPQPDGHSTTPHRLWRCDANFAVAIVDMREFLVLPERQLRRRIDVDGAKDDLNTNQAVTVWGDLSPKANWTRQVQFYGRLDLYRHRLEERLFEASSGDFYSAARAFALAARWDGYDRSGLQALNAPWRFEWIDPRRPEWGRVPHEYSGYLANGVVERWAKTNGHPLQARALRRILQAARLVRAMMGYANGYPRDGRHGFHFHRGGTEALLTYVDDRLTAPAERNASLEQEIRVELALWPLPHRHDPFFIENFDPERHLRNKPPRQ